MGVLGCAHDVLESDIAWIAVVFAVLVDGSFGRVPEIVRVNDLESPAKVGSELHPNLVLGLVVDLVFHQVEINAV